MYKLTELGIKDKNDKLIAYIDENLNKIRENLDINDNEIINLKNELTYFTIKNIYFGDLLGICRLYFKRDLLKQIMFIPSMKEYIHEFKITRQELYSCVYKAYQDIIKYLGSLNLLCLENEEKKSIYSSNKIKIVVTIDSSNESVSVIQEKNE